MRVFTQVPGGAFAPAAFVDAARLVARAALVASFAPSGELTVELRDPRDPRAARFRLASRATTHDDLRDARDAELRGHAAGMATLAERCRFVWTLAPDGEAPAPHALVCAAVVAAVALGPVLPDDASTLFGIRGALERADRAFAASRAS